MFSWLSTFSRQYPNWENMTGVVRMKCDTFTEEVLLMPPMPIYSKRQFQGSVTDIGLDFQGEMNSKQGQIDHKYLFI